MFSVNPHSAECVYSVYAQCKLSLHCAPSFPCAVCPSVYSRTESPQCSVSLELFCSCLSACPFNGSSYEYVHPKSPKFIVSLQCILMSHFDMPFLCVHTLCPFATSPLNRVSELCPSTVSLQCVGNSVSVSQCLRPSL